MRTTAILPIKRLDAAKQRLSGELGGGSRRALALAMFSDVLGALRRVRRLDAIVVVTRDRVAESATYAERVEVLREDEEKGQSSAALAGIRDALASGFERVLLVPGDTPLVDPIELDALLERAETEELDAVIVPDRHGTGTNALLLSPPDAIEPSFGPGSLDRHVAAARAAALAHAVDPVPSLGLDVDTGDDLAELASSLEERRGNAPITRGALRQLDRSRAHAPAAKAASAERAPARV
jgi:2-phospho-L-lactate/phosphoenolpyruvate guanylyltransferase